MRNQEDSAIGRIQSILLYKEPEKTWDSWDTETRKTFCRSQHFPDQNENTPGNADDIVEPIVITQQSLTSSPGDEQADSSDDSGL